MKYEPYVLEDVMNESSRNLFNVISTFAGGGGSSTGYRLAGGNVLCVNEFVEEAIATYKENYPTTPILTQDIKTYSAQDFLDTVGLKVGELDILDGSPPCSAFSACGSKEKGWDKTKKYSDGKKVENIEDLFHEFIRIMNGVKPKVVIAENVKGITQAAAKTKLAEFMNAFEDEGYYMSYRVLNAADFGTPQVRPRTIFIGIREDVAHEIGLTFLNIDSVFPDPTHQGNMKEKREAWVSAKEAFDGMENDADEVKLLEDYIPRSTFQTKWCELLPKDPSIWETPKLQKYIDNGTNPNGSYFNLYRMSPELPSPSITQRGAQLSPAGIFHYNQDRKMTTPELKRLMSLPDDFKLTGKFDQKAERIGRMVAPKMMKNVAQAVYDAVLKPYNEAMSAK